MSELIVQGDDFLMDGEVWKLVSGSIHYFRVPREYWRDRLEKLVSMGCNTVETYVPWNLHEAYPGWFDFTGDLDISAFLQEAHALGLKAIVRPSPYICGEWEFGGLPWWLLTDRTMRVRTMHPAFVQAVERYYAALLPLLEPLQCIHGGPVVACQIENEYGYYGCDPSYLEFLHDCLRSHGIAVLLFTSDGPWGQALMRGGLPTVLRTANFGSKSNWAFDRLRSAQICGPLVCMEFWNGWFDAWGEDHHTRDVQEVASELDQVLQRGHVNFYMLHGGTNFGFSSGANQYEQYLPDVTSYDYDAPLTEDGQPTRKYEAFREVISKHVQVLSVPASTRIERKALGEIACCNTASFQQLLKATGKPVVHPWPLGMEELGQGYGYVNYRIHLPLIDSDTKLELHRVADRAVVLQDGRILAVLTNTSLVSESVKLSESAGPVVIDILVENQGRVNFGHRMDDQRKGIDGDILVNGCAIGPVEHYGLPFDSPLPILWQNAHASAAPALHRFVFDLSGIWTDEMIWIDTFLDMRGWGKGIVLVNDRDLGRFWARGPQRTLYVPGPFLCRGHNEIVVFETEGVQQMYLRFVDAPEL